MMWVSVDGLGKHASNLSEVACDDGPSAWRLAALLVELASVEAKHCSNVPGYAARDVAATRHHEDQLLQMYLLGAFSSISVGGAKTGRGKRGGAAELKGERSKGDNQWYPILCGMSSVHYHHQRGSIASAIENLRALLLHESSDDDEDLGEAEEAGSVEEEERRKGKRALCLAISKANPQVLTQYCLHLFRRLDNMDEQQGHVAAFLNTCLGRIRATVLRPSEPSSSSARLSVLCQHLLVALLEAASQSALPAGAPEAISSLAQLSVLDDFVAILDSARDASVRDLLIKRGILPPLLLLSGDTKGWAKCWSLCLRVAREGDLVSASTLLCLLLHTPLLGTLHGNADFWWLLQASLLHPEGVVRKRGAFAMEAYGAQNRRAGRIERLWMDDFLDVYTQVENGNAPHLIAQVSAQLDGIFALAASQPEAAESRGDFTDVMLDGQTSHPLPTFAWAKGLVHIMLRAQLPTLRKAALVRVLEGRLRLRPGPGSFRWIFRELLPICDHPLYFSSAYFLGRGKDVGCCGAHDDEEEGVEVSVPALAISTKQTPGALFPCFLTRLMRRLSPPDLAICLRELVLTVCGDSGLKSLSAAKWVLRCFSEQSVQAGVLLPTPCLAPAELLVVRQYLRGKLASTNSVVKEQVLQGLLPLLLCCVDFGTMGLLSLVQVLAEDVGLCELLRDGPHAELFFGAVRRAGRGNVGSLVFSSSVSEGGAAALRTMACILLGEGEEEEKEEDEDEEEEGKEGNGQVSSFVPGQMAIAARLYAQPYIKEGELLAAVGFLHGFITLATLQHSQQGKAKQQLLPPLLTQRLHRACPDMATFLVVSIKGALAAPLAQATALRSVGVLEQATECLAGFLMLTEIVEDVSQSSATMLPVVALLDFFADIVRTAWSTGDASHPLRLALACKSAAILLRSLQRTWPCPRLDRAAVAQCAGSVSSLACALMHQSTGAYEATLPGKYRACLVHVDSHALSPSFSLLLDFREQGCESYSRYSLALMVGKWAAMHASLCLWAGAGPAGVPVAPLERGLSEASLLEVIVAQMECCSMRSVPSLLGCALAAIQRLFPLCSGAELEGHLDATRRLLDVAWQTILGAGVFLDHAAVYAYIRLSFDACTLRHLDSDTTRFSYATVYELGLGKRPHITQALVLQCVAAWTSDRRLCGPFVEEICALLLLKEHKQDDNSVVHTESETALLPVRIVVLSLLERLVATPEENLAPGCLDMGAVVRFLVAKNMHEDFVASAMIGSDLFGEKLRSWQALCVLAPVVVQGPLLSEVLDAFFASLTYACALPIRTHMEIFGATLAAAFPHVVLPRILNCLADFNLSQQQLASVFVMLGHLCHNVEAGVCPFSAQISINVINHIVPWLTCGAGLPRAIALYVVHILAPHVLAEADPLLGAHLRGILNHLQLNRDSIKLLGKQAEFFVQYAISTRCAVRGILALGLDATGEVVPPHVLDLVVSALKNIPPRDVDGDISGAGIGAEEAVPVPVSVSDPSEAAEGAAAAGVVLQCKRVPFDELRLTLQEEAASQQRNAAGRARQSLVVVASLVDKVTNLAGIARTCEIFAVQTLVLPSLAVVKTDEFLGIAVSAADWVPLEEVPPSGLPAYLRAMRRRGYTIACLEQTSSSVSLADPTLTLPQKCVLLLGKEKEGVPVELLQEMDLEIEIPQHGVIRSLNVHVSAALAIFEFSKSSEALVAANGGSN